MAGRFGAPALISLGLAFLNLCAFFVLLGGAAGLQKNGDTVSGLLNTLNQTPGAPLSFGDLKPVNTSGNFISYEWFKAVYQAVIVLFTLGVLATGQIYRFRLALIGLFAAGAVLYSDASNTFYYLWLMTHKNAAVPSKIKKMITSYFVGCMLSTIFDFLLIISLGSGLGEQHVANNNNYAQNGAAPGLKDSTQPSNNV